MTSRGIIFAVFVSISVSQAMPLQGGFWEDASQLTHHKDNMEQAQPLKNRNLKEDLLDGTNYLGYALEKLAPLNKSLQPQFYQDAGELWNFIRGELESLRVKISPYAGEMHQRINQNLEHLQLHLTLFSEELADQVSLQMNMLEQHFRQNISTKVQLPDAAEEFWAFAAFYAGKTAFLLDQVKEVFQPCANNMVTAIHQSTEELHKMVAPQAANVWEQLHQLLEKLTHSASLFHLNIERNLDQLKQQLNIHQRLLTVHLLQSQGDLRLALQPAFEHMAQGAQRTIEEFRKELFLQAENFRRVINREVEEMKLTLAPSPSYVEQFQENPTSLQDLHGRLESLWKDISQSLNELNSSY